jgi:hypothetical protein
MSSEGGVLSKPNYSQLHPSPSRKLIVTATSKMAKPKKTAPKTTAATKAASVKPAVKNAVAAQPSSTKLVVT